jgi:replicative DNA helicase
MNYDIEIEQCIIGAMLLEPSTIASVISQITPEMFFDPRNQSVYSAIIDLTSQGQPVDLLTTNRYLRKSGDLESIGAVYLSQLTSRISSTANLDTWCKLLYEFHLMRSIRNICLEIADKTTENESDAFDLYSESISRLESILASNIKNDVKHISQLSPDVTRSILERMNSTNAVSGYSTSIKSVDTLIGGHQKSDLMYMAGRPAMGKTAMALTEVLELGKKGVPVAFFSLEMSSQQITFRLMSMLSGIDGATLMKYRLDDELLKTYYQYLDRLNSLPIYVDDTPALSVIDLRAKVKRLQHKHQIEVVFVDYVQLMTSGSKAKGVSREQELSHISRNLKLIAKECNLPMIVLAQLSRGVESRSEKRPLLSDLRESGSLEQDADIVTFLFRPEYYDMMRDERGNSTEGLGEYIVAKQRNGGIGIAPMRFHPSIMKYTDYTENPF